MNIVVGSLAVHKHGIGTVAGSLHLDSQQEAGPLEYQYSFALGYLLIISEQFYLPGGLYVFKPLHILFLKNEG